VLARLLRPGVVLARLIRFLRIAQDGAFPAWCPGTALLRGPADRLPIDSTGNSL
jgi:hypothetical protein